MANWAKLFDDRARARKASAKSFARLLASGIRAQEVECDLMIMAPICPSFAKRSSVGPAEGRCGASMDLLHDSYNHGKFHEHSVELAMSRRHPPEHFHPLKRALRIKSSWLFSV